MKATLSILALYNYDNAVFDNLLLPVGIDKDDVVNNLLLELAELEIIYPNYDTMKAAIGFWSKKELSVWNKLYDTTQYEYNAIHNFDRTEEYTDTETRNLAGTDNETRDLAGTDTRNSVTNGTTTNNGTDTSKEYVSGFNEAVATLAKQTEQLLGTGNIVEGTVVNTDGSTDTGTVNKALTDTGTVNKALTDTGTVENIHAARMFGNIGVMSTQQMIEQERKVSQFNVIDYIIDSFKKRFCILIY